MIPWFSTAPLTKSMIQQIEYFKLLTFSHDQGWADDPMTASCTWFEIQIVAGNLSETRTRDDGKKAAWRSHANLPISCNYVQCDGQPFNLQHELRSYLHEGDYLEVTAHAIYRCWENYAGKGMLRVYTKWEPSYEMLQLIRH
ncbi:hypothetical protein BDV93DRAFT_457958 [Ceratobasidium sp. AG-I]|nr:hypothetical protein BDV93DRAFT_457958 [Ceratobasidium sp. AG-I]